MSEPIPETSTDRDRADENATVVYEPDDTERVSTAVLTAVDAASETDARKLKPLYEVVDPDALDALFAPRDDGTPRDGDGHVTLLYGPYRIRVADDDRIAVFDRE
ncbi:HalOD1 output domain-containing protein [Halorussus sp. AFM4]|uniref:HalOD1 output domain-containing protein n=1 Tax=Halorussus sp. AFM4 TaxID=3421651 RepID=UPI003EBB8086